MLIFSRSFQTYTTFSQSCAEIQISIGVILVYCISQNSDEHYSIPALHFKKNLLKICTSSKNGPIQMSARWYCVPTAAPACAGGRLTIAATESGAVSNAVVCPPLEVSTDSFGNIPQMLYAK